MQISRVLLCRPNHFTVDYIINPHMKPHSVDQAHALKQWQELVKALEKLGISVDIIEQAEDVPDMVFATDQGIVGDNKVLLANFRYPERQKERPYYDKWFTDHGFETTTLTDVYSFEGGDSIFFDKLLFIGTGYRANVASCEELAQKLDVDVIPLRLVDPMFYHLDMAFLAIDDKTAFYYPPAFSRNSQNLLRTIVRNLHELTKSQAEAYAANSFVSGDDVIIQVGIPGFKKQLESLGKSVTEVDISEFKKAGGASTA